MSTLEIRHISRNFWLLAPFLLLWEKSGGSSKEEWQYLSSKLCLTKRCVCLVLLKNWEVCFFFFPVLCGVWWGPDTNIWAVHTTTWIAFALTSDTFTVVHRYTGTYRYTGTHRYTHVHRYRHTHVHRYRYTQVHTTTWIAFTLTSDTFTDDLSGFDNIMAIVMMAMFMVLEIMVITSINKYSLWELATF